MSKASQFHDRVLAENGQWPDFEGLVRDIYVSILRPGNVALDVGMNKGDHLLQMAPAVGSAGLVIGIEAAPAMVALTRQHLLQGGIGELKNVILYNFAVGEKESIQRFNFVKDQPGLSSLAVRDVANGHEVEVFDCHATTIDRLLFDMPRRVDFAKLDIEGAEYHALMGARRLFERDRPPIVFEFDKASPQYFGYHTEDLLALFRAAEYEIQDFFGFSYESAQDLNESGVWNYFAAPSNEIEGFRVKELVGASLTAQGVRIPA